MKQYLSCATAIIPCAFHQWPHRKLLRKIGLLSGLVLLGVLCWGSPPSVQALCIPLPEDVQDGDAVTCTNQTERYSAIASDLTVTVEAGAAVGIAPSFPSNALVLTGDDNTVLNHGRILGVATGLTLSPVSFQPGDQTNFVVRNFGGGELLGGIGLVINDVGEPVQTTATIENHNLIQGTVQGIFVRGDGVNLHNGGRIFGEDQEGVFLDLRTNAEPGTATVTNLQNATIRGGTWGLRVGGDLNLNNQGTIEGQRNEGVSAALVMIDNSGDILGGIGVGDGGVISNTGDIIGTVGIKGGGGDFDQGITIINHQLIRGTTHGIDITGTLDRLENTGTIEGGAGGDAVRLSLGFGEIRNTGTITTLGGAGVQTISGVEQATLFLHNDGEITGNNRGLEIDGDLFLANTNMIEGGNNDGIFVSDNATFIIIENQDGATIRGAIDGMELDTTLDELTNAGRIEGLNGEGIDVFGAATINNTNTGTISGTGDGIQGRGGALDITNQGFIIGDQDTSGSGTGVRVTGPLGFDDTVTNAGIIQGAVASLVLGGGDDTVTNTGQLLGGVFLGEGNDMVRNHGTITGDIQAFDGNDTVINGGTINGNVILGEGNDTFLIDLDAATPPTVTGIIDAGPGQDRFGVSTTQVKSTTLAPTAGFEELAAEAKGDSAELTLNQGVAPFAQTLTISGGGTIINHADFEVTEGSAIEFIDGSATTLQQEGMIKVTDPSLPAITMGSNNSLTTLNRIESIGGGVEGGNSTKIAIEGPDGLITTTGIAANGITVIADNDINISQNAMVVTQGQNASGIVIEGSLNDVKINSGGTVKTLDHSANGIDMGLGSENKLVLEFGGKIETLGNDAVGVVFGGIDNEIHITEDAMVMTQGQGAHGFVGVGSNVLNIEENGTVQTTGQSAYGVQITGFNNLVELENGGSIETSGDNAVGIVVEGNGADVFTPNSINIISERSDIFDGGVSTSGAGSHGIELRGAHNEVNLNQSLSLVTAGDSAHGIVILGSDNLVGIGGNNTFDLTPVLETTGQDAVGVLFRNTGNSFGNSSAIVSQQAPAIAVSLLGPSDNRPNTISINHLIRGGNGIAIQGDPNNPTIEEVVLVGRQLTTKVEGDIRLFSGNDLFEMRGGEMEGDVVLGEGNDTATINRGKVEGNVVLGGGDDTVKIEGGGLGSGPTTITGLLDGGPGDDNLLIANDPNLPVTQEITLGNLEGFETRTANAMGVGALVLNDNEEALSQGFSVVGSGRLINNADFMVTEEYVFKLDSLGLVLENSANLSSTGVGAVPIVFGLGGNINHVSNNGMIVAGGGVAIVSEGSTIDSLSNFDTGTIVGGIDLGGGTDTVHNGGLINGSVQLGNDEDNFIATATGGVTGIVDGGEDVDGLTFSIEGSDKEILGDRYVNFEILDKSGDEKLQLGGTLSVDTGTVSEGELVLLPDSVLDLEELTVESGATLSGEGTVTGDVIGLASSTISPGFSPGGPLTIQGDLDITDGGKLLIEIASQLEFDTFALGGELLLGGGEVIFALEDGLDFSAFAEDFAGPVDFFFVLSEPTDPNSALLPWTDLSVFEGVDFFVSGSEFSGLVPLTFLDTSLTFAQSNLHMDGGGTDGTPPIPEPSTWLLWLTGLGLLLWLKGRYRLLPKGGPF